MNDDNGNGNGGIPMKKRTWVKHKDMPTEVNQTWMNPLNKIIWHQAFCRRAKTVTIKDGRKFDLDYDRQPGKVLVTLADGGFAPRGWFDLELVTDKAKWLSDETVTEVITK